MAAQFVAPVVIGALIAWRVWSRVRSQFGLQPIRRKQMILRIVIWAVLAVLIAGFALIARNTNLLLGLAGGLVLGAVLGTLGLHLTRFQVDPVKGDCYIPNPYIGMLLTVLLVGRLVWRFVMVSPQMLDSTGTAQPLHGPDIGQSPLTLGVFGVIVGYYICYFAGLLIHHRRIARERPGQIAD